MTIEYFDDRFYKISKPEQLPENFNPNFINGDFIYLPSSTTIIGNSQPNHWLARWRGEVGNERADQISQEALMKGSIIHNAIYEMLMNNAEIIYRNPRFDNTEIDEYIAGLKTKYIIVTEQEYQVQLARFVEFVELTNPQIEQCELKVINLEIGYAGTLDLVMNYPESFENKQFKIEAGRYIADVKTGKAIDETSYFSQMSSYMNAYNESYPKLSAESMMILWLNSNTRTGIRGFKAVTTNDFDKYFNHFLNLKRTFDFNNSDIKPKLYEIPQILKLKKEN